MTTENRRTYWDDASSIQIVLARTVDAATLWQVIEQSAEAAGLRSHGIESRLVGGLFPRERRNYGAPNAPRALGVSIDPEGPDGAQVSIHPAYDRATTDNEADVLADLARRICVTMEARIARSLDVGPSNGYIGEDELEAPLRWIDWWQYLAPALVEAIGRQRLLSLAVFEASTAVNGGVVVRATRSPNEAFPRRPLAAHLGISLKPWRDWRPETQTWSEREWPY